MKKILVLLLTAAMAFSLLAGCGSGETEETTGDVTAPAAPTAPQMSAERTADVALVTGSGGIYTDTTTQACWQAVRQWCNDNELEVICCSAEEDSDDARIVEVARGIAEGARVVILPGEDFEGVLRTAQKVYPHVDFIAVDMDDEALAAENTACVTLAGEQAGYLAGYAAVMEGFRKLAVLGSGEYAGGFICGADAAALELGAAVEICRGSADGWDAAGLEELYRDGTQVIFAWGSTYYTALEAAASCGGKVIGMDVTAAQEDREFVLTSAVLETQKAVETVLDAWNSGRWDGYCSKVTCFGLAEGDYVGLSTDSWTMEQFTAEEYETVKSRIADGSIVVDGSGKIPEVSAYVTITKIQ